ncbi:MAG TPA: hypothetical protein VHV49_05250, partial [Pseudonocardiaceae bacterium]|nr:hypothetical protein [Pseudonocardiaceae bacterium]
RDEAADAVGRIAPSGATFTVTDDGAGIVVDVRDPAAGGLLPGVHVTADAYAVPEPDADDDAADTEPAGGDERSTRSAGGDGR